MKKILSLILSVCTLLSVASCTMGGGNSGDSSSSQGSSSNADTGYKLVENSTSDYKLVVEDDPALDEDSAAFEVKDFFKEATSVKLDVLYESEVTYSANSKLIIFGDTEFTQYAGVDVSEIPDQGFTIKTVDSNVFILGEDKGVLYGAYEFLSQTLGYKYFLEGIYSLDKDVKDLALPNLNLSDAPDFAMRADGWHVGGDRTRTIGVHDPFMRYMSEPLHNTFGWLRKEEYQAAHSGWYSPAGTQLCYTARGNANELAEMRATVLEKFKACVDFYYEDEDYLDVISFTQQDNTDWCNCSACQALMNQHGGAGSATVIEFLNPIATELQEWVDEEYPGREVGVAFFAYHGTNQPPTNMEMADNLYVWMCLPTSDTLRTFDDPANAVHKRQLDSWAALSNKLYIWRFDSNWNNYLLWWDTFGSMQDFYQYVKDLGAVYVFNEGLKGESAYTGFDTYKAALNFELMWDVDTDVEAFAQQFFDTYFKDAADSMLTYYNSYREWSAGLIQNGYAKNTYGGAALFNNNNASHWPASKLNEWLGYIEQAYEDIDHLFDTDPDLYDELYDRINKESMAIRYAQIQFHGGTTEMKYSFKEDAIELGFTRKAQMTDIATLLRTWGI